MSHFLVDIFISQSRLQTKDEKAPGCIIQTRVNLQANLKPIKSGHAIQSYIIKYSEVKTFIFLGRFFFIELNLICVKGLTLIPWIGGSPKMSDVIMPTTLRLHVLPTVLSKTKLLMLKWGWKLDWFESCQTNQICFVVT